MVKLLFPLHIRYQLDVKQGGTGLPNFSEGLVLLVVQPMGLIKIFLCRG